MVFGTALGEPALPTISIEKVFREQAAQINNYGWIDNETVVVSLKEGDSNTEQIVALNVRSAKRQSLGSGQYPSVSPNGRWVVYLDEKQWQLRRTHDPLQVVTIGVKRRPGAVVHAVPTWSRDSTRVAIAENVSQSGIDQSKPPESAGTSDRLSDPYAVNVIDLEKYAQRVSSQYLAGHAVISIVDVTDTAHPRTFESSGSVYSADWGAGKFLYFVDVSYGHPSRTSLTELDTSTLSTRAMWHQDGAISQAIPSVSPDGRQILLTTDIDNQRWEDFVSLISIDTQSGQLRRLTDSLYVTQAVWSPSNGAIFIVARQGDLSQIYQLNRPGDLVHISSRDRKHTQLNVSPNGEWLSYRTEDGYGRRDVRVRRIGSDQERTVYTIAEPARTYRLGKFDLVQFTTRDGLSLYGYIVYPPDFRANRRYPLYVDVHGGGPGAPLYLMEPFTILASGSHGPLGWHAWAALGYVVFVPDFRSSGEYGPGIAKARYAESDFRGIGRDVEDIEDGTKWMMAKPFIDPQRVGVMGHSAGGARVNLLLTRTHLYRAAIINEPVEAGPIDMLLTLTTGELAGGRFEDVNVWESTKSTDGVRFAENPSAYLTGFLFDGYKNSTPTLIMDGNPARGAVCPISQEVLFAMLRQYGVPTRLLRYMDDGHAANSEASAIHRFNEARTWLEKYMP